MQSVSNHFEQAFDTSRRTIFGQMAYLGLIFIDDDIARVVLHNALGANTWRAPNQALFGFFAEQNHPAIANYSAQVKGNGKRVHAPAKISHL